MTIIEHSRLFQKKHFGLLQHLLEIRFFFIWIPTTSISLFRNNWIILQQLHEALDTVLNTSGEKQLPLDRLTSLENHIDRKKFSDIAQYIATVQKFSSFLSNNSFISIPKLLHDEIDRLISEINGFMTQIRTIRARYKQNTVFEKISLELSRTSELLNTMNETLFTQWLEINLKERPDTKFQLPVVSTYADSIVFWIETNTIKEVTYSIYGKPEEFWKPIEEWGFIKTIFDEIIKTNKSTQVFGTELMKSSLCENHPIFKDLRPLQEFLFALVNAHNIIEHESSAIKEKGKNKEVQTKISAFFDNHFKAFIKDNCSRYQLTYNEDESALKILPALLVKRISALQEELQIQNQGDLQQASRSLQSQVKSLIEFIDNTEDWFNQTKFYLQPFEKLIQRTQTAITRTREDVERMVTEFENYATTVREESFRSELSIMIEDQIKALEAILKEYEGETSKIIEQNFPEVEQMQQMLVRYETKVLSIKEQMKTQFQSFKDKDIDLYPSIKLWNEKYEELRNRIRFTITNLITAFIKRFQNVISEEELFFQKLGELSTTQRADLPKNLTTSLLQPERMNEKELRERIRAINEKLLEIEGQQHFLEEEKAKFQEVLGNYLKTSQNVEGKQCVICHKIVDVTQDHYIRCEFCKCLSHYSCAAWWINKYNSCPVCHNAYMVPNATIYDPDGVEQDEDK